MRRAQFKTLHLTNAWHASSGGIRMFYKALLQEANRQQQLICLIVPSEQNSVEEAGEFGKIYHVQAPSAPYSPAYRILYPNKFLFPGSIVRILQKEQPDVVEISDKYTFNYLGGLLRTGRHPLLRFRPTVIGVTHERMDENLAAYITRSDLGQSFCRWYMKSIYFPMFDHHIAVSEHTASELIEASHGHKVDRGIWIAPMGVDCGLFHQGRSSAEGRRGLTRRLGIGKHAAILVYAGRLAPEKNVELLLEVMRLLPQDGYQLAIAGAGILKGKLMEFCGAGKIENVTFLGHLRDRESLADLYANADMFVHPNPREPFGIAPLEAMASGLALVGPRCGGILAYANDTNAWLAEPNPGSFAEAIVRARHDDLAEQKRALARQTAEQHDWPRVTAHFLKLCRQLHQLTQGKRVPDAIPPRAISKPVTVKASSRGLLELLSRQED